MRLQSIKTVHVRRPARPAEHRPGLIFLLFLFFVSRQRKERHLKIDFFNDVCSFFCLCKRILRQAQDKIPKEKHTGNDPDSYRDSRCRTP